MPTRSEPAPVSDDDGTEDAEENSPGGWQALGERYKPDPEPEEFDPMELGPDIPEAPDMTEVDASSEVQYRFWALVMVFNVALLVTSLGVLFVTFQGAWELGGQLTLAGLLLSGFGYYRYRRAKATLAERDDGTGNREATDGAGGAEDDAGDRNG